jgi:hypothetical protein
VPHLRILDDGRRECPVCSARFRDNELAIDARLMRFMAEHPHAESATVRRYSDGLAYAIARPPKPKPKPPSARAEAARADAARWDAEARADAERLRLSEATERPMPAAGPKRPRASEHAERPRLSAAQVQLMVRFVPAAQPDGHSMDRGRGPPSGPSSSAQHAASDASGSVADFYAALTRRDGDQPAVGAARSWRCAVCDVWCTGDEKAHARTIAHQFARSVEAQARGVLPEGAHVSLPTGNVGYRMMRDRLGWEEGQGLGKSGEGALQPLPTRLKRDRRGLRTMADPADGSDGEGEPSVPPLRVTHPAAEVMGAQDGALPTKAERRQQRRIERKRQTYLQRCKELIVRRELLEVVSQP